MFCNPPHLPNLMVSHPVTLLSNLLSTLPGNTNRRGVQQSVKQMPTPKLERSRVKRFMIPVKLNIKTFIKFEAKSSAINSHFEAKAKLSEHFAAPLSSQGKRRHLHNVL